MPKDPNIRKACETTCHILDPNGLHRPVRSMWAERSEPKVGLAGAERCAAVAENDWAGAELGAGGCGAGAEVVITARGLGTERVIFRSHALLLQSYRGVDMAPRKFFSKTNVIKTWKGNILNNKFGLQFELFEYRGFQNPEDPQLQAWY